MKLAMGCDPAAYRFYQKLLERMKDEGYDIIDTGCESENEADGGKYAEIAEIVSNKVKYLDGISARTDTLPDHIPLLISYILPSFPFNETAFIVL